MICSILQEHVEVQKVSLCCHVTQGFVDDVFDAGTGLDLVT